MSASTSIFRPAQSSWRADPAPDLTRRDVTEVQIAEWTGVAPGLGRSAEEVALASWEGEPWPETLVSHACLLSEDGLRVAHYLQWRGGAPDKPYGLSVPLPGVQRRPIQTCELYRSRVARAGEAPGAVAIVVYETAGEQAAHRFVETMTDPSITSPPEGLIAGHYHVSRDGLQVLNYAEWVDAAANTRFRGSPAQEVFNRIVEASPGVRPLGGSVYRPFARRKAPS